MLLINVPLLFRAQIHAYGSAGHFREIGSNGSNMSTAALGILVNPDHLLTVGLETHVNKFWDYEFSSMGLGARSVAELGLIRSNRHRVVLIAKAGAVYMFPENPGTALNFTFMGGPAYEYMVNCRNRLRIEAMYTHFSNGKTKGDATNPTWDGAGINIAWLFR
ncbi:MAG: acyloxyacyl hydrolase [Bacteroidota bacterium]